jgi:hypothetical protein
MDWLTTGAIVGAIGVCVCAAQLNALRKDTKMYWTLWERAENERRQVLLNIQASLTTVETNSSSIASAADSIDQTLETEIRIREVRAGEA